VPDAAQRGRGDDRAAALCRYAVRPRGRRRVRGGPRRGAQRARRRSGTFPGRLSRLGSPDCLPVGGHTGLDFRILGSLDAWHRGPVVLPSSKPRALLALLLLHPNETLSTDRLVDALW